MRPIVNACSLALACVVVLGACSDSVGGPRTITTDVEGDPDQEIVDGSFLAGLQGWGSITRGFSAVIGVSGDPDKVFDEYMA